MPTAWGRDPHAHEAAAPAKRSLAFVLDPDPGERRRVAEALVAEGLEVLESSSPDPVLALRTLRPGALFVVASELAPVACEAIRRQGADAPVLVLVEPEDADAVRQACEAGADDFAARPVDGALLRERARLLLRRARERAQLARRQRGLESAQRLARSGSFAVDLASGVVDASARVKPYSGP